MLLLCFHVLILLAPGQSASGGNNNARDVDDLVESFETIDNLDDLVESFETIDGGNNRDGSNVDDVIDSFVQLEIPPTSGCASSGAPISQLRLLNIEPMGSESTLRGCQSSTPKTAYAQERSMLHSMMPRLPFTVTRFALDRLAIYRQRDRLQLAIIDREMKGTSHHVNREIYTACRVIRNRQRAFEDINLKHIMDFFEKTRTASVDMLATRPLSNKDYSLHLPIDIDTDVELMASFVVDYCRKNDVKKEFESHKEFIDTVAYPEIQRCDQIFKEEMPDDVYANMADNFANEALHNFKGYEIRSDDEVIDHDSNLFEFLVSAITAERLCKACDELLSLHHKARKANKASNLYLQDLRMLASLMTQMLPHIENDFKGTANFLTVAKSVVSKAESLGYFAPVHDFAGNFLAVHDFAGNFLGSGFMQIAEIISSYSSRIAKIKRAIQAKI